MTTGVTQAAGVTAVPGGTGGSLTPTAFTTFTAGLPAAGALTGAELIPGVQGGGSVELTAGALKGYIASPVLANVVNRPPQLSDNTNAGYTTASVWQYGGTLYSPSAYCANDSAAWTPAYQSATGTPVDVMGTTLTKFAGGTCAMLKGYVGAAVDVAVTVAGVYQIATINMLATGELDNVALGAVMAQADVATNVKVIKVYDQSGNGNHATLASAAGIPVVVNATVTTGTTLTVNSVTTGTVVIGQQVFGNGIPPGITVLSGAGPYVLSGTGAPANPGAQAIYLGTTSPPYIDWDSQLGRYVIYSPDEITNATTTNRRTLQLPQTMALTSGRNFSVYAVGVGVSSGDQASPILLQVGDGTIAPNHYESITGAALNPASSYGQLVFFDSVSPSRQIPVSVNNQPMVFVGSSSAGGTTAWVNENTGAGGTLSAQTLNGGYISCAGINNGLYSMMKTAGIAIFNAAVTSAQSKALRLSSYTRFNIFPQVQNQVALLGDSRLANHYVTPQFGVSDMLPRLLGRNWNVLNLSVDGDTTLRQMGDGLVPTITGTAKSLATLKSAGLNYAVILLGVNDFHTNNASVATALGYLQTYALQIAAAGWIPVLISELSTTDATNSANTKVPLLHAAIQAAGPSGMNVAAIIDVSNYTPVMTPANVAYYYDGLHPTLAVHGIIASAIARQLAALGVA